jgi:hypothetical protein
MDAQKKTAKDQRVGEALYITLCGLAISLLPAFAGGEESLLGEHLLIYDFGITMYD